MLPQRSIDATNRGRRNGKLSGVANTCGSEHDSRRRCRNGNRRGSARHRGGTGSTSRPRRDTTKETSLT